MPKRREISSSLYRDYKYTTITNFKGIDNSQNAFESDIRTASEALNVYLDEKNILATRPRFDFERYIPISVSNTLEMAYLGKFIFHKYFEDIRLKKINSDEYLTGDLRIFTVKNDLNVITTHIDYTYGSTKYRTTLTGCTEINDAFINGESLYVLIDKPYKVDLTYDNGRHKFEVVDDAYYIPTTKTYTNFLESTEQDVEAPNLMSDTYKIEMNVNLSTISSKSNSADVFNNMTLIESDAVSLESSNYAEGYTLVNVNNIIFYQKSDDNYYYFIAPNGESYIIAKSYASTTDNYTLGSDVQFFITEDSGYIIAVYSILNTDGNVTGQQVLYFTTFAKYSNTPATLMLWNNENTFPFTTAVNGTENFYKSFYLKGNSLYASYTTPTETFIDCATIDYSDVYSSQSEDKISLTHTTGYKYIILGIVDGVELLGKFAVTTGMHDMDLYYIDLKTVTPTLSTEPLYTFYSSGKFNFSYNALTVYDSSTDVLIDLTLLSQYIISIKYLPSYPGKTKKPFAKIRYPYNMDVGFVYMYEYEDLFLEIYYDTTTEVYRISNLEISLPHYFSKDLKAINTDSTNNKHKVYDLKESFLLVYEKEYNTTYNTSFDSMITYKNNYLYYSTKGNHICISINNDPLYLAETTYSTIGDSSPIVACLGISDSYYAIFKRNRTYGASISTLDDFGNIKYMAVSDLKTPIGCIAKKGAIVTQYSNMPLLVYIDGIYGIYQQENVLSEDHIFTKMSSPIDILFGDEDLKESLRVYNMNYWTIFSVYNRMYILDNRSNNWFYWETPVYNENQTMALLDFYTTLDDVTHIVTTYGYEYKLSSHDEDVVSDGVVMEINYVDDFATYNAAANNVTVVPKKINWKWTSQIIPLTSINYDKTLYTTKFMMVDNDENSNANEYTFDYSIDVYRRHASSYEYKRITRSFNDIVSRVVRTYIPSLTYLKLTLTNEDNDNTYETMQLQDNNQPIIDCRLNLLGLEFKHTLKESKIR